MSAIIVVCACGQRLRAKNGLAGKSLPCPGCGKIVMIPGGQGAAFGSHQEFDSSNIPAFDPPPVHSFADGRRGKSSSWAMGLAALATVLSGVSLGMALLRDPLGSGLEAYDFSSPQAALTSALELEQSDDIRAGIELARLRNNSRADEKLKTTKVHKESTYEGKKLLFISYEENGLSQYDVAAFEKHADTGYWLPSHVSTYSMNDNQLKSAIQEWEARSGKIAIDVATPAKLVSP